MRVTCFKNVDVEFEADVAMEDVLAEFSQRVGEADATYYRRTLEALDQMTRIFASLSNETIAAFPIEARVEVRKRLLAQAERYL